MEQFEDDDIRDMMDEFGCSFNEAVAMLARRDDAESDDADEMPW